MNQLDVHDPDEDVLRRALAAEAEGVTADGAFATRVAAAVGRDTRRRRGRTGALALAAAALVAVGLVTVIPTGGSDDVRTDETTPAVAPATRPHLIALIREDGWLVTFDTRTGEQRELWRVDSPEPDGRPLPLADVAISPDGRWVYFSTGVDSRVRNVTFRIPAAGGARELVGYGGHVQVSPDGHWVALVEGNRVGVVAADGADVRRSPGTESPNADALVDAGAYIAHLAWSPDGRRLGITVERGEKGTHALVVPVEAEGGAVSLGPPELMPDPERPGEPAGRFLAWSPESEPLVMGPGLNAHRGVTQDASGRWLLWQGPGGAVYEQEWGSDEVVTIPDVPAAVTADW